MIILIDAKMYCKTSGDMDAGLEQVLVFQHFSMNRFTIDLAQHSKKDLSLAEEIKELGKLHREEIFGR